MSLPPAPTNLSHLQHVPQARPCRAGGRYDTLVKAAWHPAAGLAPTAAGITIAAQPLMACLAESRSRPSGSLHQSQVRCEP